MPKPRRTDNNGMPANLLPSPSTNPWDMQPGEPARWYARFEVYRSLGPHRTLMAAHQACAEIEGKASQKANNHWYVVSRKWAWQKRACAWDDEERKQLRASERDRRFELREERLKLVHNALHGACAALEIADLRNLTQQEARDHLSNIRQMIRDMSLIEEREFGVTDEPAGPAETGRKTWCADELREIQRQLDAWRVSEGLLVVPEEGKPQPVFQRSAHRGWCAGTPQDHLRRRPVHAEAAQTWQSPAPEAVTPPPPMGDPAVPHDDPSNLSNEKTILLVCTGPESIHEVDGPALSAIKSTTGLGFHRILSATPKLLERYLRGERLSNRPVTLLHMAATPEGDGLHLADIVVNGDWLHDQLSGVRVMLLTGCTSNQRLDWARDIPHFVTVAEGLTPPDAASLSLYFWSAIGRGSPPGAALDDALAHCASQVSEFVTRHW